MTKLLLVFFAISLANLISERSASPLETGLYSKDYFAKIINDVQSAGAQWEVRKRKFFL